MIGDRVYARRMDLRRGRRGRTAWWPVAWATALLVLSACSGGDDAASTTSSATPATPTTPADPVTTPPAAASTLPPPPPTTAPTTTTLPPPSTTPTSTDAPGTIPPPTDEFFAELEAVLPGVIVAFVEAVNVAFRDPGDPARRAAIAELATPSMVSQLDQVLDDYAARGRFFRESAEVPPGVDPILASLATVDGGLSAGMDACVVDTDVLVERTSDGGETVVRDTPRSSLVTYSFELVDGEWLVSNLDVFESFPDAVTCS